MHKRIYLGVYWYRYKNLVYHLSIYVFNSISDSGATEMIQHGGFLASAFSYCWWLPTLHGDTCSYISMTGKQIPGKAWMRCAMMQFSTARCFPKRCGSVMRGIQTDGTFLTGALRLEPSTQCWLLPWLAMLGVCFALNWIGKAQLVITTRGRGLLCFADVGGNLKLWFSGF